MIELFLKKLFVFGRVVSAVIALIAILAIVVSGVMYLAGGPEKASAPKWEDVQEEIEQDYTENKADETTGLEDRREVEKRFGDDLAKMAKEYSFGEEWYKEAVDHIITLEPDQRKLFVSGLDKFLKSAKKFAKDYPELKNDDERREFVEEMVGAYAYMYEASLDELIEKNITAEAERKEKLVFLLAALLLLMNSLFLPLLIQIELNTRNKDSATNLSANG